MKPKRYFLFIITLIILITIPLCAQENNLNAGSSGNEFWSTEFGIPGTDQYNGLIYAIEVTGSAMYIGGDFLYAQDSLVRRIARWDGSKFCCLAGGTNGSVYAIEEAGGNIYVGGSFDTAGTVPARNIAMWDGSGWHALGSGIDGPVRAIEVSGTNVFAGGSFNYAGTSDAKNVARWNGSAWGPLGNGTNGQVNTLKILGTDLYLGGSFAYAGTKFVNHIAKWDGLDYDSLGSGTSGNVMIIEADENAVYAGGGFLQAGVTSVNNIARWQNNSWSKVGSGVDNQVNAIVISEGNLYIGGAFGNVGILPANGIAKWNGSQWSTLGTGMNQTGYSLTGIIYSLKMYNDNLFAGGYFDRSGDVSANCFAYWDGSEWRGVGPAPVIGGANTLVYSVFEHNGELYAGGMFTRIGNINAKGIAKWNGSTWIEIGGGLTSTLPWSSIICIAFDGNDIYVGGYFNKLGSVDANNIAKWNGSEWSALGDGVNGYVWDIKAVGGNIYAAGEFSTAGTTPASKIAKWNGMSWAELGNGFNSTVYSMLPVGSELYAAGDFWLSGPDTLNHIAKWDGMSWSKLGEGLNNFGRSLCYDNGLLYAGGGFTEADGIPANHIAAWNGSRWSAVGTGLNSSSGPSSVMGIAAADGKIYAAGYFDQAGVMQACNTAVYNGGSWQPLGNGLSGHNSSVLSVYLDYKDVSDYDVYFGGQFSLAGGIPSYNIAKYSVTTVDVEKNSQEIPKEFALLQNYPNPFNPETNFGFRIPASPAGGSEFGFVTLKVYDILGNEVSVLINEEKPAGEYKVHFNAGNLSSGVYFYRLRAGSFIQTKKMVLLK